MEDLDEHSPSRGCMGVAPPARGAHSSLDGQSRWRQATASLSLLWDPVRARWLSGVSHPTPSLWRWGDQGPERDSGHHKVTQEISSKRRKRARPATAQLASVPGLRLTAMIVTPGKSLTLSEIPHMEDRGENLYPFRVIAGWSKDSNDHGKKMPRAFTMCRARFQGFHMS